MYNKYKHLFIFMLKIPFYKNSKDNLHCVQACLKSVLKYYFPKKDYSFRYLDRVTAHKKDKGTWLSAALLFLAQKGFEVIKIEIFDYKKFARLGEKYLERLWTDEVYQEQKRFSDFKKEQKLAKLLVKDKRVKLEKRPATLKDIRLLFKKNYILLCTINPCVLRKEKGYYSHLVVVTDVGKHIITFHDPGPLAFKNKTVSLRLFMKSMRYPSKRSSSLLAVKLKNTKN